MHIDWQSSKTTALVNPRISIDLPPFPDLKGHLWLLTSGTSGPPKWVALSKEAFLASAESVNGYLGANQKDVWINPLPLFHVGGLAILARGHLSGSAVFQFDQKWDPREFSSLIENHQGTLTSLVPTQVFDLVSCQIKAPLSLRKVFVGGGRLAPSLYDRAIALGWPLVRTYGMTEIASQIAVEGKILPHVEAKVEGTLMLKSPALFSGYFTGEWIDPKVDGWFQTEDLAEIKGDKLKVLGRKGEFVKIGEESTSLSYLNELVSEIEKEAYIVAVPDERLGSTIELVTSLEDTSALVMKFNEKVLPIQKIRSVRRVEKINRTPLGKISRCE